MSEGSTSADTMDPMAKDSSDHRPRFIMDYSMNKIAKYLRMLGYDTLCDPSITHDQIINFAADEDRALVSCSSALLTRVEAHNRGVRRRAALKAPPREHRVVAYDSDGDSVYSSSSELAEAVIRVLPITQWRSCEFNTTMVDLIRLCGLTFDTRHVLGRCVTCNELLALVPKESIRERVEPRIFSMYGEFTQCPVCHKVFWGFDGDRVVNYKSFRTLELLRSLCLSAGAELDPLQAQLSTLRSFRSFPRRVKSIIFSFLGEEDLRLMSGIFPVLTELIVEVAECRRRGVPVAPFSEIKASKKAGKQTPASHPV